MELKIINSSKGPVGVGDLVVDPGIHSFTIDNEWYDRIKDDLKRTKELGLIDYDLTGVETPFGTESFDPTNKAQVIQYDSEQDTYLGYSPKTDSWKPIGGGAEVVGEDPTPGYNPGREGATVINHRSGRIWYCTDATEDNNIWVSSDGEWVVKDTKPLSFTSVDPHVYYRLNGNAKDSSGHDLDGSFFMAAGGRFYWDYGVGGGLAAGYQEENWRLDLSAQCVPASSDFGKYEINASTTMALWFKLPENFEEPTDPSLPVSIFQQSYGRKGGLAVLYQVTSSGDPQLTFIAGNESKTTQVDFNLVDGEGNPMALPKETWIYVAGVVDWQDPVNIFISGYVYWKNEDGTEVEDYQGPTKLDFLGNISWTTSGKYAIGAQVYDWTGTRQTIAFNVVIDDVKFFWEALTLTQLQEEAKGLMSSLDVPTVIPPD